MQKRCLPAHCVSKRIIYAIQLWVKKKQRLTNLPGSFTGRPTTIHPAVREEYKCNKETKEKHRLRDIELNVYHKKSKRGGDR